jgi:hypothetical protein
MTDMLGGEEESPGAAVWGLQSIRGANSLAYGLTLITMKSNDNVRERDEEGFT